MSAAFGDGRLPERFWSKVEPEPNTGCWLWSGSYYVNGYGAFGIGRGPRLAHRVSYMALAGDIPPRLHLDHLCRVRGCVNPDHLEPVTCRTNLLRGIGPSAIHAQKTHCPRGHEYHVRADRNARGCRTCDAARARARWKSKASVPAPVVGS